MKGKRKRRRNKKQESYIEIHHCFQIERGCVILVKVKLMGPENTSNRDRSCGLYQPPTTSMPPFGLQAHTTELGSNRDSSYGYTK